MGRVTHFEIHADDPTRAIGFYEAVFGWTFQKWEGPMEYWLVVTGADGEPGINGGLMKRQGPPPEDMQPVSAYVCTAAVESLDQAITTITGAGGVIAVPKMAVPGVGWLAYFKDTEGNIFGAIQPDSAAA